MDATNTARPRRIGEAGYYALALLVGLLTGGIGTALHLGVERALTWPHLLRTQLALDGHLFLLASGAFAALLTVAAVWLVRTFAPEAAGSGVQEIEGAMDGLREVRPWRILPVKFVGGLMSLGAGLVVGREGPTIHMGASVAQIAATAFRLPVRETRGLLAAGAAAGLAAAFNAPLAAILFVIEETRRQFPYGLKTYTAVILASAMAGVVVEATTGLRPFMLLAVPDMPLWMLPAFALLGAVLGTVGVAFNRCLVWSLDAARHLGLRTSPYLLPLVVGFAVGVLITLVPEATMGGETLAVTLAVEKLPLTALALIVAMRFLMTMASYSTGVPGGIFAPILALATAIGVLFGATLEQALPLPPGAAAALGVAAMGGLFSATVRAPLVGVVLVAELTGAYGTLVPAILTCVTANLVADWLGGRPIYEVLLERTLRLAGQATPHPIGDAADGTQKIGGWDETERRS